MPMPESTIQQVNKIGMKEQNKDGLLFLNRKKEEFDFIIDEYEEILMEKEKNCHLFLDVPPEYPGIELENDHEVDRVTYAQEKEDVFGNPHTKAQAAASNVGLDHMDQEGSIPLDGGVDNPTDLLEYYYEDKGDTQEEKLKEEVKPKRTHTNTHW